MCQFHSKTRDRRLEAGVGFNHSIIELLGGATWGVWANQGINEPRSNKEDFQGFGMGTFVLHGYSVNHDSQIPEPAWLPHNKEFCGPESQQTFLWVVFSETFGLSSGDTWKTCQKNPFTNFSGTESASEFILMYTIRFVLPHVHNYMTDMQMRK